MRWKSSPVGASSRPGAGLASGGQDASVPSSQRRRRAGQQFEMRQARRCRSGSEPQGGNSSGSPTRLCRRWARIPRVAAGTCLGAPRTHATSASPVALESPPPRLAPRARYIKRRTAAAPAQGAVDPPPEGQGDPALRALCQRVVAARRRGGGGASITVRSPPTPVRSPPTPERSSPASARSSRAGPVDWSAREPTRDSRPATGRLSCTQPLTAASPAAGSERERADVVV